MLGRTGDATYQVARLDVSTHAQNTIDYAHHEIHDGSAFTAYYTVTTAATAGHRSGLYIRTPIGIEIHLVASFSSSIAAVFSIHEDVVLDVNEGTNAVVIYNRHRNSAKVSNCKDNATNPAAGYCTTWTEAQIAAANLGAGTILRTEPLEAGTGPKPAGGVGRDSQEYILKQDTRYLFMITNTPATANTHHILIDWYEHTPRSA